MFRSFSSEIPVQNMLFHLFDNDVSTYRAKIPRIFLPRMVYACYIYKSCWYQLKVCLHRNMVLCLHIYWYFQMLITICRDSCEYVASNLLMNKIVVLIFQFDSDLLIAMIQLAPMIQITAACLIQLCFFGADDASLFYFDFRYDPNPCRIAKIRTEVCLLVGPCDLNPYCFLIQIYIPYGCFS